MKKQVKLGVKNRTEKRQNCRYKAENLEVLDGSKCKKMKKEH